MSTPCGLLVNIRDAIRLGAVSFEEVVRAFTQVFGERAMVVAGRRLLLL